MLHVRRGEFFDIFKQRRMLYHIMHRLLSAILLLCFGALASLQAAPLQRCLVLNQIVLSGAESCGPKVAACCRQCHSDRQDRELSRHCCTDVSKLSKSTAPAVSERLPEPVVTVLISFFHVDVSLPALLDGVSEAKMSSAPVMIPPLPLRRQALLRVWTV